MYITNIMDYYITFNFIRGSDVWKRKYYYYSKDNNRKCIHYARMIFYKKIKSLKIYVINKNILNKINIVNFKQSSKNWVGIVQIYFFFICQH